MNAWLSRHERGWLTAILALFTLTAFGFSTAPLIVTCTTLPC